MSRWLTGVIIVMTLSEGAVLGLHASGRYRATALAHLEPAWAWGGAVGCVVIGVLAMVARIQVARRAHGTATVALSVATALVVALGVPVDAIDESIPQVAWVPMLVAAVTTSRRWIVVTAAIVFVAFFLRAPEAAAFHGFSAWIISSGLLALVVTVRGLHETGIREADRAHAAMLHAMFHDLLTQLPNRHAFVASLDALRAQDGAARAVLRIDIEQFSLLNDTLGHAAGDIILRDVAGELRTRTTVAAHVARVGADDFLLLLTGEACVDAEAFARSLATRLEETRTVVGREVHLTLHIGIAHAAAGELADAESILQRAEQALTLAKRAGRRRIAALRTAADENSTERAFEISQALHGAVERGELSLVYQPIVCLRTDRTVKVEALARWTHPRLGAVGPADFIPVAEATGAIHGIGDWVLHTAARQVLAWRELGARDLCVSVNRSPVQFREDGNGVHPCLRVLADAGAPPDSLVLEITEGVILDADATTRRRLASLRAVGVRLSLDDFGTGYSSIGALHSFEIDALKIDRRFVSGLARGSKELVLCESIIRMAHALGMSVVAEGIETESQRELLVELGCDRGQGYLLGRPMSANALTERLATEQLHAAP